MASAPKEEVQRVISQDKVFLLFRAFAQGNLPVLQNMIKYFTTTTMPRSSLSWGLSIRRLSTCTPLHVAALTDNKDLGKYILDLAASQSEKIQKPMLSSVSNLQISTTRTKAGKEHDTTLLRQLFTNINVDTPAADGTRPLHWAARLGRENFTTFLIERKANVHAFDNFGASALHVVCAHSSFGISQFSACV